MGGTVGQVRQFKAGLGYVPRLDYEYNQIRKGGDSNG